MSACRLGWEQAPSPTGGPIWSYMHRGNSLEPRQWFAKQVHWFRCIQVSVGLLLEEQMVCKKRKVEALLAVLCCRDVLSCIRFSGLLVQQRIQRGPIKEVLQESFGESTIMTLTNGLEANGREGANHENLDLFSVSHSVCVLFLDFSWGQL